MEQLQDSRSELANACCTVETALPWSAAVAHLGQVIRSLRFYYPVGGTLVQLSSVLNMCLMDSVVLSARRATEQAGTKLSPGTSNSIIADILPLLRKVEELAPAEGGWGGGGVGGR